MALDVLGNEKPVYYEGQEVLFDLDGIVKGPGIIRGRGAAENIIDMWIVEIHSGLGRVGQLSNYPWSCLVMSHHQIKANPNAKAAFRVVKCDPEGCGQDYTDAIVGKVARNATRCCKNCGLIVGDVGYKEQVIFLVRELEPLNDAARALVDDVKTEHPGFV